VTIIAQFPAKPAGSHTKSRVEYHGYNDRRKGKKQFGWRLIAQSGEVQAAGEGHDDLSKAKRAVRSACKAFGGAMPREVVTESAKPVKAAKA
jgi:hypothetical protein